MRHLFSGWIIVLSCFLIISLVFGIRFNFGIFFDELIRSDEFGWNRGDAASVYTINMIVLTLSGAGVGWMLDRVGARVVFALGLLIMASGLAMTSQMTGLLQFYLFYGVWAGLGMSMLGLGGHSALISQWFSPSQRRGLAIGLAFAGTGVGVLALAPLSERLIAMYNWRIAFLDLAMLLVGVGIPLTLLLRNAPAPPPNPALHAPSAPTHAAGRVPGRAPGRMYPLDVGSTHPHAWTWREAIATPTFWLIMASGTLSFFSLRMVTVHQVAHLVDHGVPRLIAATVLGNAGLISAIAFILLGFLSDHAGREVAFVLGSVAQIGALGILMVVWNGIPISMLYLYSVLWGIGEGSRSGLLTAIANDIFPGPSRATIVGSLVSLFAIGAGVGSWSGGAFYDRGGTYTLAFGLALVATSVATGCLLLTRKFRSSPEPGIIPVTSDE